MKKILAFCILCGFLCGCSTTTTFIKTPQKQEKRLHSIAYSCYLQKWLHITSIPRYQKDIVITKFSPHDVIIKENDEYYTVMLFLQNQSPPHYLIDGLGKTIYLKYFQVVINKDSLMCHDRVESRNIDRVIMNEPRLSDIKVKQLFEKAFDGNIPQNMEIKINALNLNNELLEIQFNQIPYWKNAEEVELCVGVGCNSFIYLDRNSLEIVATWPIMNVLP